MAKRVYYESFGGALVPVKNYRREGSEHVATVSKSCYGYHKGEELRRNNGYHFVNITRKTKYSTFIQPATLET